jgi:hypothetical protein
VSDEYVLFKLLKENKYSDSKIIVKNRSSGEQSVSALMNKMSVTTMQAAWHMGKFHVEEPYIVF